MRDGTRKVVGVAEVQGMEGPTIVLQNLFAYDYKAGKLRPTGLRPVFLQELNDRGIEMPPLWRSRQGGRR
ncbi:MAG: CpaF family protein, partial [Actinomycetota bacterium]